MTTTNPLSLFIALIKGWFCFPSSATLFSKMLPCSFFFNSLDILDAVTSIFSEGSLSLFLAPEKVWGWGLGGREEAPADPGRMLLVGAGQPRWHLSRDTSYHLLVGVRVLRPSDMTFFLLFLLLIKPIVI